MNRCAEEGSILADAHVYLTRNLFICDCPGVCVCASMRDKRALRWDRCQLDETGWMGKKLYRMFLLLLTSLLLLLFSSSSCVYRYDIDGIVKKQKRNEKKRKGFVDNLKTMIRIHWEASFSRTSIHRTFPFPWFASPCHSHNVFFFCVWRDECVRLAHNCEYCIDDEDDVCAYIEFKLTPFELNERWVY